MLWEAHQGRSQKFVPVPALGPAFKPLTAFGMLSPQLSGIGMQILCVAT